MARKKAVKKRKGATPSKRRAPAAVSPQAPPPERAPDL